MENEKLIITDEELPYAYWLYNIKGVGKKTVEYLRGNAKTLKSVYEMTEKETSMFLTQRQRKLGLAGRLAEAKQNWDICGEFQKLDEKNINFTCIGHHAYPKRLEEIPDAPGRLYYKGRLPDNGAPAVAIIGARNCSEYGRRMAEAFAGELAMAGVDIISGMARGIDGIGQRAALEAGGYSLGVMGCGVDICYPSENRQLYDTLCARGGVCSEYPPATEPDGMLFPARNRIISAFSDIVLVIEAKHKSGTLITVDMALEQGKEVYALPGRVCDALSEGCNRLLQQGAGVAASPRDILRALMEDTGLRNPGRRQCTKSAAAANNNSDTCGAHRKAGSDARSGGRGGALSEIQSEIIEILDYSPMPVELIKEQMLLKYKRDLPLPELFNNLMRLSLTGHVRQVSNSSFAKGQDKFTGIKYY